jgi:hypothetical protein
MANARRARKAAARKSRPPARGCEALRKTVSRLAGEMEEPLLEALHLVQVLSLIEAAPDEDNESIGFVATKAAARLRAVNASMRDLFDACKTRDGERT